VERELAERNGSAMTVVGCEEYCLLGYNAKSTDVLEEHVASIFRVEE
jgi:hypothetical protein